MAAPPPPVQRGDVYWVDLNPVIGSEQAGRRPAVVISPEVMNEALPVVVVAAITTTIRSRTSLITPVLAAGAPLPQESCVLTFQIRTIDKRRLEKFAGRLTVDQIEAVGRGVAISFGLRQ